MNLKAISLFSAACVSTAGAGTVYYYTSLKNKESSDVNTRSQENLDVAPRTEDNSPAPVETPQQPSPPAAPVSSPAVSASSAEPTSSPAAPAQPVVAAAQTASSPADSAQLTAGSDVATDSTGDVVEATATEPTTEATESTEEETEDDSDVDEDDDRGSGVGSSVETDVKLSEDGRKQPEEDNATPPSTDKVDSVSLTSPTPEPSLPKSEGEAPQPKGSDAVSQQKENPEVSLQPANEPGSSGSANDQVSQVQTTNDSNLVASVSNTDGKTNSVVDSGTTLSGDSDAAAEGALEQVDTNAGTKINDVSSTALVDGSQSQQTQLDSGSEVAADKTSSQGLSPEISPSSTSEQQPGSKVDTEDGEEARKTSEVVEVTENAKSDTPVVGREQTSKISQDSTIDTSISA